VIDLHGISATNCNTVGAQAVLDGTLKLVGAARDCSCQSFILQRVTRKLRP
jgi:hypothetical protein